MHIDDELSAQSPWLKEQRQKGDGMRVPEGYFEDFEQRVFEKIDREAYRKKVLTPKQGFSVRSTRAWMAAAAGLALVLAALWFIRQPNNNENTLAENDLNLEEVTDYLVENAHDFDLAQLEEINIAAYSEPHEDQSPEPAPVEQDKAPNEVQNEDVKEILEDMTDEELESLING